MFTGVQEAGIVNLVLENNEIRLREIQSHIIQDNTLFNNIQRVSLSTLARILKRNQIRMKQLYKVPFERNSQRNRVETSICGCKYYIDCSTPHATLFPSVLDNTILTDFCSLFSGSTGNGCSCNPTWVHLYRWGWVQPSKDQKKGEKRHWPQSHYRCSWPTWWEHHNVRCHLQYAWCPPPSCQPWTIQHRPYSHISGQTSQHSHTTRAYEWCRPSKKPVCCSMGQRELSSCSPSPKLVCWPPNISRAIPPTILTISEPHRRVIFGMAVEGIRPAALCAHASCAGHGRGMWWDWCGCNSGMDKALKALLPSMSGKGRYCLWCWRGVVARPGCAARCCLIIFLASFFYCNIFFLKFSFSVYCFL